MAAKWPRPQSGSLAVHGDCYCGWVTGRLPIYFKGDLNPNGLSPYIIHIKVFHNKDPMRFVGKVFR